MTCTGGFCKFVATSTPQSPLPDEPEDCRAPRCGDAGAIEQTLNAGDVPPAQPCRSFSCGIDPVSDLPRVVVTNFADGTPCVGGACSAGVCVPPDARDAAAD
jgi:hypothetical protein